MKYIHTNIVAKDWKKMAQFYKDVFHCKPLLPERDLKGDWIDRGTCRKNTHIQGIHMLLPGHGDNGPTLEIFQYDELEEGFTKNINTSGFAHLAFKVNNVEKTYKNLLKFGGKKLGEIITKQLDGIGTVTFVYAKDPEGNIVEIQSIK